MEQLKERTVGIEVFQRPPDYDTTMHRSGPISRRTFCAGAAAAALSQTAFARPPKATGFRLVADTDRRRILDAAARYIGLKPETITSFPTPRSPGGLHDFFSQADYFWPNPAKPDGPYVNRDGQSNPDNFNDHRKALIALSIRMPALTAAWVLTRKRAYGEKAADHLRAWFIQPETRMNPNLEYAQGVKGVSTGRSYGIIDTLQQRLVQDRDESPTRQSKCNQYDDRRYRG